MNKPTKPKKQIKTKAIKTASETIKKKPYQRRWGNQFTKIYTDDEIEKIADDMLEWFEGKDDNKMQTYLQDFCIKQRIGNQRISEFVKKSEYFAYIHEICMDIQKSRLIKGGLLKKFDTGMAIFVLKNNHNMRDKFDGSSSTLADGVEFVES